MQYDLMPSEGFDNQSWEQGWDGLEDRFLTLWMEGF